MVEIPLDILLIDRSIGTIRFAGDLKGTFYIDDLRLVAKKSVDTAIAETAAPPQPQDVTLEQNYPNPFNGETAIRFALLEAADVELEVFNLAGQRVTTLLHDRRTAGAHTLYWNGRDGEGNVLASGVYVYRLQAEGRKETRKLLLMR